MRLRPLIILLCVVVFTSSCASSKKVAKSAKPKELTDFSQSVVMQRVWSRNIGHAQDRYSLLRGVKVGSAIYVANIRGDVFAVDAETGGLIWRNRIKEVAEKSTQLSGGVGAHSDLILLGDERGRMYALSRNTGEKKWMTELSAPIMSQPVGARNTIVARTADGKMHARASLDGRELWTYTSTLPLLTLRGYGTPLIVSDAVIAGWDDGHIIAMTLKSGEELWRYRLARPEGDSVVERLVDVDGDVILNGEFLHAVSYQGNLGTLSLRGGTPSWVEAASSYWTPAVGLGQLYIVDDKSHLLAYDERTGQTRWSLDVLEYRELSAPVTVRNYVAMTDKFGYCHLVSQLDGNVVGRVRHNRKGIRAPVIADGNFLYILGNDGRLSAYEISAL
jgi:outer membrane protein assembly factor BamB